MTLDEAIKHCLEVAQDYRYQRDDAADINDVETASDCQNCADDHEQLAEWLTDYKELKNSVGAVKLGNMKEALELIREYKADNVKQREQIAEYKRLLKLAVEDMKDKNFCKSVCSRDSFACRVSDTCDFRWRYADEVENLIGGEADE